MTTLTQHAQRFRELKDRRGTLEAELKECNAEITLLETDILPKVMDENEIEKFTTEGVGTIYTQVKVYASVLKENEQRFHDWLNANGHGDIIRDYVFPATLSSFAKEQIEAGVELPDFIKTTKIETAMLRRK